MGSTSGPWFAFLEEAYARFMERDVVAGVHLQDRIAAKVPGFRALQSHTCQRRDQRRGAVGVLERIDDAAMHHVLLGLMRQLRFGEEEFHVSSPAD